MKALKSLRLHIGLFGKTNVGKSSFLNKITSQSISIVSDIAGTTTDIVEKSLKVLVVNERQRLKDKIANFGVDVDPQRIEQEVALAAQRSDVEEEYDRLRAHIKEVKAILDKGGICGKRLDFMMQEFNRETNTLASKAATLDITQVAIELKVLIEQMREQVQNIE